MVDLHDLLVYLHPATGRNAMLAIAVAHLEEMNLLLVNQEVLVDWTREFPLNVDIAGVVHATVHISRLQGR